MSSYVRQGRPIGRPLGSKDSYQRTRGPNVNPFIPRRHRDLPPASSLTLFPITQRDINLTDEQIVRKLDKRPKEDSRVVACRAIFQLTGQWPWDWAAGFEPESWTTLIVRDLRILLQGLRNNINEDPSMVQDGYKQTKDMLRQHIRDRNSENPRLRHKDIIWALETFPVDLPRRSWRRVRASLPPPAPLAPMAPMAPPSISPARMSVSTKIDLTQDHMDEGIECNTPQTPFMDEGLFDDDGSDAMSISSGGSFESQDESVQFLGSSPQSFQSLKRPRVDEPAEPFEMHIYNVASIEPEKEQESIESFEMHIYDVASFEPSAEEPEPKESFEMQIYNVAVIEPVETIQKPTQCQLRDISDLISGLDLLQAKEKEEQENATKELTQLKDSIPVNETQIISLGPEVKCELIAKWNQTLKSHKKRCMTMQNGRAFFEKKQQEELDNPNPTTIETIQRYDARIAECVASIKHVEEQIEEKKKNDAQLLLNLKVQVWKDKRTIQKLEPRTKELAENLEYYKSLKEFLSLGAVGMETLLLKLKYDNVPILEMIEEVKKSFDTAPADAPTTALDAAPDAVSVV